MNALHTGSCSCRAVRFETSGMLRGVIYCHCTQCRKQSGHYFAATQVDAEGLRIDGAQDLTWYAASQNARRGFCRRCGSGLFWQVEDATRVSILAGAFDQPSDLQGLCHIFTADKGSYYSIDDGLPQYPAGPPESALT